MSMNATQSPRTKRRVAWATAIAAGLASFAPVSQAQELPPFRKGLWEFNRTVPGPSGKTREIKTKDCTNPTDDMRKQNDMLAKSGCKFTPVTKSGKAYSFSAQCVMQGMAFQSKSVITAESDSAYKVDVESLQGGAKTREQLVARRVGDC